MAAVKTSPPRSTASPASSPEATVPEQPQQPVPKRKGGRKPVYATQEERKMRNRAAQAAFRERRTEYIKHLEATIKHHEEQLSGLQQSSRNAADEVLMLRYKNSLLERILMEKGIDVAAELRAVSQYDDRPQQQQQPQHHHQQPPVPPVTTAAAVAVAAPSTVAPVPPHPIAQQSGMPPMAQMHRPVIGRPHAPLPKRSLMNAADPSFVKPAPEMRDGLRAIPASRNSSPSVVPTMPTPPQTSFALPQQSTTRAEFPHPGMSSYYPSPYQTHMEELGKLPREYDAELMDDVEEDAQGHLDQQPTPDEHGDSEMTLGGAVTQPPEARTSTAGYMFDSGFESMFASEPPAKHDAGLSDIMRQYNQMPFSFATSNLR